jgi:hypothetical protein
MNHVSLLHIRLSATFSIHIDDGLGRDVTESLGSPGNNSDGSGRDSGGPCHAAGLEGPKLASICDGRAVGHWQYGSLRAAVSESQNLKWTLSLRPPRLLLA